MILRVNEERVIFDMQKLLKFPEDESLSFYFNIDLIDDLVYEYKDDQLILDSLERCLAMAGTTSDRQLHNKKRSRNTRKRYRN